MSNRKSGKKYAKFCPRCKSSDVSRDISTMQSLGYIPTKYICNKCGFSSFTFPEVEISKANEIKEDKNKQKFYKESELIDTSYGNFYVRVMWKIIGPIFLIAGLIYLLSLNNFDFEAIIALCLMILGSIMIYITFIKLR